MASKPLKRLRCRCSGLMHLGFTNGYDLSAMRNPPWHAGDRRV